ncbi:hypothetical protein MTR_4g091315 [Medicago truncatula]|uniref:Uncharacterized protein n=1 Tax=Medicago truncatula TaxID=3880 RepID=A0A072UZ51_MEDTR|nr:hypothetical protein MTR_4g091315 [Medicago truncatula]
MAEESKYDCLMNRHWGRPFIEFNRIIKHQRSAIECINMFEYPHPFEVALIWDEIKSIKHGIRAEIKIAMWELDSGSR